MLNTERKERSYPLPQAVAHDTEIARILQNAGLLVDSMPDAVEPYADLYVADEAAVGVAANDGFNQAGVEVVDLAARVAQSGDLDDGGVPDVQLGAAGQREQVYSSGSDVLPELPGVTRKPCSLSSLSSSSWMKWTWRRLGRVGGGLVEAVLHVHAGVVVAFHTPPGPQLNLLGDRFAEPVGRIPADCDHHRLGAVHELGLAGVRVRP